MIERNEQFRVTPNAGGGAYDFHLQTGNHTTSLKAFELSLMGEHQAANAGVALATIEELRTQGWHIDEPAVRRGLAELRWPARIEVVAHRPTVVIDSAHNVASVEELLKTLDANFPAERRILIFATTRDKDAAGMLKLLAPRFDRVILTRYQNNPRGVPVEELEQFAHAIGASNCIIVANSTEAWQLARSQVSPHDLIAIAGSFFIAAEMSQLIAVERGTQSNFV